MNQFFLQCSESARKEVRNNFIFSDEVKFSFIHSTDKQSDSDTLLQIIVMSILCEARNFLLKELRSCLKPFQKSFLFCF